MKKVIKNLDKLIIIFFIMIIPLNVYASQGCCSHHGGIDYCGNNGYYICNDGTRSPSCKCTKSLYEQVTNNNTNCSNFVNEITDLKNELKEEKRNSKNFKDYLIIVVACNIIYFAYKVFKLK